ncbi:MAG: 2-hydroxyacyl-CoA dehydratase [Caldiserica bacterium]|nr:2-hydroxyacyl-CoA dehydratase [Caldisericota bacterium]
MTDPKPAQITHQQWDEAFKNLPESVKHSYHYLVGTKQQTDYLNDSRCFEEFEGDARLKSLLFDNSLASLRLWSFLLSEEGRLHKSRAAGKKIIGTMKDLGTAPILAYACDNTVAFYPDGAWWVPCVMEMSEGLLRVADSLGFGDEMCPARAALAAFFKGGHFPMPDLLVGAVGCCCDDFSSIQQRVADMGIPLVWWELPYRREASSGEPFEITPTGLKVPTRLVDYVVGQLARVKQAIEKTTGQTITNEKISKAIGKSNQMRQLLAKIRDLSYGTVPVPFPSLETQICEMIALHFCSEMDESIAVLDHVAKTIEERVKNHEGVLPEDSCRCVWVNPVADLRVMNMFESLGGTIAGTEYLFRHALVQIPTDIDPMRALALTALCDPMIGSSTYRAQLIVDEAKKYNAEGVIISNIPGASHCATEGTIIRDYVQTKTGLPVLEVTVPPLIDSESSQLATRFEAFFETIRSRRKP